MKFKALQENLRKILWTRIQEGRLTGLRLASQTGFQQAHISNFLNRKRGLSTEGMDKVLQVQHLSVLDLIDPAAINERASSMPAGDDGFASVALVEAAVAARQPRIMRMKVKEIIKFRKKVLARLRSQVEGDRRSWERFVVLRMEASDKSMYPRLPAGAHLLIDRHYNSLKPYGRREPNIYAVNQNGNCTVKYVEMVGRHLLLRPHDQASPVEIVPIDVGKRAADYLIGRVCHVSAEL
jgi:hypothetical protein